MSHCETHRGRPFALNQWDSTHVLNQLILNQMLFCLNSLMVLDLHFFLLPFPWKKQQKKTAAKGNFWKFQHLGPPIPQPKT